MWFGYVESIVECVCNLLICGEGGYLLVDDVVCELYVLVCMFKCKFVEYGVIYLVLFDEIWLCDVLWLFEGMWLLVDEIVVCVGYIDCVNFMCVFKCWMGVVLSEWC